MSKRARLLFDSAKVGVAVGTRGPACPERSLLFAADSFSVDMVVFPSDSGLQVIHGQVIDMQGLTPVRGATVRWGRGSDVVETDHYGQFTVSGMGSTSERILHLDVGGGEAVECAVPALVSAGEEPR